MCKLTADEQGITSKDGLSSAILHKVADAVLCVAGRVNTRHLDITNLKCLLVFGCLGDAVTVFATNDVQLGGLKSLELLFYWIEG